MTLSQFKPKLINLPEAEAKELVKQVRKERFIQKEKPKKKKKTKTTKKRSKSKSKKKNKTKPYSEYTNKDILILLLEQNQEKIKHFKENAPKSKVKILEQNEQA